MHSSTKVRRRANKNYKLGAPNIARPRANTWRRTKDGRHPNSPSMFDRHGSESNWERFERLMLGREFA